MKEKKREAELFFYHREGHQVPVLVRIAPILDNEGMVVGAAEIFSDNYSSQDLTRRIRELERMALLDPLTKLGNRRYGEMNLTGRIRELRRYGWSFGVLFIDERSTISLAGNDTRITISIGATLARKKDSANGIIKRADSLMYAAKKAGRNRVMA